MHETPDENLELSLIYCERAYRNTSDAEPVIFSRAAPASETFRFRPLRKPSQYN
jgi:hypothetical protein